MREHPDLYAPELRLRLEANLLYPAIGYVQAQQARLAIQMSMAALFNQNQLDVLIAPSCPGPLRRPTIFTSIIPTASASR